MTPTRAAAKNPHQWITLYASGHVRIHALNMDTDSTPTTKFRTLRYKPSLSDQRAILRLIHHLNLTSAGIEGETCEICDCRQ